MVADQREFRRMPNPSSFPPKRESILPLLVIAAKAGIQCLWLSLVSLLVITAKAGIQFLVLALVVCRCVRSAATERNESEELELDSRFGWNDEPKARPEQRHWIPAFAGMTNQGRSKKSAVSRRPWSAAPAA